MLVSALPFQSAAEPPAPDPLAFVDPLIGPGPEGHTFPGATAPFGMVQLSPATAATCPMRECCAHPAGSCYNNPKIHGFSHTRFSRAAPSDHGTPPLSPQVGPLRRSRTVTR